MSNEKKSVQERVQSIKDITLKVKDSFTLRQFTMILIVVFGVAANITSDYLTLGFDASIFTSPAYWINLCISQGAVIVIMLCLYGITSEREENANNEVQALRKTIFQAHCDLTKYRLNETFDNYVYVQNMQRKKKAYTQKMQCKIFHAKTDEQKKALERELQEGLKIIESLKVRYNRICIATIFSRSSLPITDDENLNDGKAENTRRMLRNKIIGVIAFGILLSTLAFEPDTFSMGLIVKTCVKLFQASYAIYVGGSEGVNYVRGPLLTALDNRAQFIQKFIEHNMPDVQRRQEMEREQEQQQEAEAQEILRRRDAISADSTKNQKE